MSAGIRSIIATLTLLTATSCGGEIGTAGEAEGLDAPDRTLAWSPEPVYAVGGFDAEDWATFGQVSHVAFDADGYLYVLDGQASSITRVSPTGEFAGTVARAGEGPGELSNPLGMTVTADGRVAVSDFGHRGFALFSPQGEWLGNVPVDMAVEGMPTDELAAHPDGSIIASGGFRMNFSRGGAGARTSVSMGAAPEGRPIHRYSLGADSTGRDVFVAWDPPPPPEGGQSELSGSSGSGGRMVMRMERMQAFEPALSFGVLPDGRLVVADSSAYALKLVDPATGSVGGTLTRPISPTVVDERIQEMERARQLETVRNNGMQLRTLGGGRGSFDQNAVRQMMEERIANMAFYPEIPVIEDLAVDPDGRIWVQRASGTPGQDGPTDIITADRRYLGTLPADGLRIPEAFGPDGLIAVVELDEFDVPTIRVLRIPTG